MALTKDQATDTQATDTPNTEPAFTDFRGTEDHKIWKELNLKLCPKCRHKPLTGMTGEFICANSLSDCEGIRLWKSIHEKSEED